MLASFSIPLLALGLLVVPSLQHRHGGVPFSKNTTGFLNPVFSTSAGGYAYCITGIVKVHATTTANQKLLFPEPANQYEVTASFVHFLQANSSQATEIAGGPMTISSTFDINAKLCYPKHNTISSTIQFLIHGIGFDKGYWNFAPNYSFIDTAAQAGYPTFSYDRLGVGQSSHPDPIQVVQAPLQVEIAHTLISLLRSGSIAGRKFNNVVGVGHSFGSIQCVGILDEYPTDFDAVVLTGFGTNTSALETTFADFNSAIAAQHSPEIFEGLENGYLVVGNEIANQFAFFYYPNFELELFHLANSLKQTYTYGEIFTLLSIVSPALSFTGPLYVVMGEYDYIFTQGNAYYPSDAAALVQPILFPNASQGSRSLVVPGAGHALNLHYGAGQWFGDVQSFIGANGL